jgi:hypothetical protein
LDRERTVLETDKGTLHEPVFVVDNVKVASRPLNIPKPEMDVHRPVFTGV